MVLHVSTAPTLSPVSARPHSWGSSASWTMTPVQNRVVRMMESVSRPRTAGILEMTSTASAPMVREEELNIFYYCIFHNTIFVGFEGLLCENDVDDCLGVQCPTNKVCVDLINKSRSYPTFIPSERSDLNTC